MSKRGGGRGKKSHKGQRRHFTSAEEMQAELERNEREKEWRAKKGLGSDEEEDDEKSSKPELPEVEESSSEDEEDEDEASKPKGVSGLIQISNPNRMAAKPKKASADVSQEKVELSRREREELEKQQHNIRMLKLQDEGKTDQAKADLARLAIIRKQREEAAKKRELEKKAKETTKKK